MSGNDHPERTSRLPHSITASARSSCERNSETERARVISPLSRSSPNSKVVPFLARPASTDFGNRQKGGADPPCIGGYPMPTYISLISFTQKGVESIKDGPKRL